MVFSLEKWNNEREFQHVIKSSAAVDFNSFEPVLREAFDLFIRPVLGEDMTQRLIKEYKEDTPDKCSPIIYLAQRANASLAVWYNFYELTVILSGSGIQKAETGDYKGLYKYQERQLRENYKTKGFNALDDLLLYLEQSSYPEYRKSPAWLSRSTAIVPGADTVQKYLPIERSRLIFLRLEPHISFIEKTRLPGLIGEKMLSALKEKMGKQEIEGTAFQSLLNCIQPVVILYAAARLVRGAGTLTDKGLYFSSVLAGMSGNDETSILATKDEAEMAAKQFETDAAEYLSLADRFIQEHFPEYFRGKANDAFNVNNDNRKIFWGV